MAGALVGSIARLDLHLQLGGAGPVGVRVGLSTTYRMDTYRSGIYARAYSLHGHARGGDEWFAEECGRQG